MTAKKYTFHGYYNMTNRCYVIISRFNKSYLNCVLIIFFKGHLYLKGFKLFHFLLLLDDIAIM